MRRNERVEIIQQRLQALYPDPPIPLDHRDTFTLLVAVLLSAQCTDKKVNEVTPALFAAAPNQNVPSRRTDGIYPYIQTLGFPAVKSLEDSQKLIEQHSEQAGYI